MIIYADNAQPMGSTTMMTPAHHYCGTSDWCAILQDMENGNLPTGTGQPFPVNFDSANDVGDGASPWTQRRSSQLEDPPVNQIIGPKAFGL